MGSRETRPGGEKGERDKMERGEATGDDKERRERGERGENNLVEEGRRRGIGQVGRGGSGERRALRLQ